MVLPHTPLIDYLELDVSGVSTFGLSNLWTMGPFVLTTVSNVALIAHRCNCGGGVVT
jgi:hypothetical protein